MTASTITLNTREIKPCIGTEILSEQKDSARPRTPRNAG